MKSFHDGKITLHAGDCLDVLKAMPENSIDAVVTDPPYHLTSIVKRYSGEMPRSNMHDKDRGNIQALQYKRLAKGFMGKQWDGGDIAFRPELWTEVLRVLKPGGHMVAFSGTRTYHRMAVAIEDAGFEIRDQLAWVYGSGFPKSHNLGNGWGTALKPAWEPICLARKPLSESTVAANVLRWGTGALNIDGCRIPSSSADQKAMERVVGFNKSYSNGEPSISLEGGADGSLHKRDRSEFDGSKGRWPANLCHDGSPEVLEGFPDANGASSNGRNGVAGVYQDGIGVAQQVPGYADSGSAARFFYTAKADADDRLNSKHPTVKPVDFMQWLVRLVCPKGATVLDPFAGTGTTGAASFIEGRRCVLIEREVEYLADIERRMELLLSGPDERARKLAQAEPHETLPLFA
jgi:site-specific DNA-methyltransferase (adenine-specific)